jgi:Cd2+/Zn2+-exporting ATPase
MHITAREYKIAGLDCANEVSALKRVLDPLTKSEDALQFDLIQGKLTVTSTIEDEAIQRAVRSTGMTAVRWSNEEGESETNFWKQHGNSLMAGLSGTACVSGAIYHGVLEGWRSILEPVSTATIPFPLPTAALYLTAIATGAYFFAPRAWFALRALRPDMNLLVMVAALGALALGEWFEAAVVCFLFAVSLRLEQWSVGRARNAISALMDLTPPVANVRNADGIVDEKPVDQVSSEDIVCVRPGDRMPVDGVVTSGRTTVNQAPLTGESMPVEKTQGDEVFAGTINLDGAIEFRCTKPASDSSLARIVRMVEDAQSRRTEAEQWVEQFARVYTPAMMAVGLAIAFLPPLLVGWTFRESIYAALVMLLIACPCALVISTPVTIVAGLAAAARRGVLIKGGAYLEAPARLKCMAFDKTGTLTRGVPSVQSVVPLDNHSDNDVLGVAAAIESSSTHPLAQAITTCANERGIDYQPATSHAAMEGMGAEGVVNNKTFWLGSHRLVHEKTPCDEVAEAKASEFEAAGQSVVMLGNDDHLCGLLSLADAPRDEAREVLANVRALGIDRCVMLTGDNEGTAKALAQITGVDEYQAGLLPQDKLSAIADLRTQYGPVGMVGDGINDTPAMAAADVAIAMGAAGSDAAVETADIALMGDDLSAVPWLLQHSRRVSGIIKQNVAIALGLKIAVFVLALSGYATLWMAIAGDMGASLIVIFNGLRALRR